MKSGRYFIGDPCYPVSDKQWDKMIEETQFFENDKSQNDDYGYIGTEDGDGLYTSSVPKFERGVKSGYKDFAVDSGGLGYVHESLWDMSKYSEERLNELGHIVDELSEFKLESNGDFSFKSNDEEYHIYDASLNVSEEESDEEALEWEDGPVGDADV